MYKVKTILIKERITPRTHANLWKKIKIGRRRECWKYNGWHSKDGYPSTSAKGKQIRINRLVYTIIFEEIERGLVLDHLCRNRWCVNPYHLEQVTNAENIRRGKGGEHFKGKNGKNNLNSRKTHCPKGHEYSGENLGYGENKAGIYRYCITCNRTKARQRYKILHRQPIYSNH